MQHLTIRRLCQPGISDRDRGPGSQAKRFGLLLVFCLACLVPPAADAADPVVYVGASTQHYITRFDRVSGKSTKLAPAGLNATSFVVSPDGSTAYVARYSDYATPNGGIDIVSLSEGKLLGSIEPNVANYDTNLALSADGSLLYFGGAGQLQIFDTASQTIVAQVPLGTSQNSAYRVALVAAGSEIYITSSSGLQAFTVQALQPITIHALPKVTGFAALAASPDGNMLYGATPESHTIASAIDTTTNTVIANFPYSNEGGVLGIAVSPDGQTLYLSNQKGLFRLSTATGAFLGQLIATPLSGQIAPSSDGKYVYVNRATGGYIPGQPDSLGSNFPGLLQIDPATGAIQSLPIGGVAIAEQTPAAANSFYILQTLPYINTEDPNTLTITANLGAAGGTELLTASADGAVVAGVSNPSVASPGEAIVTIVDTTSQKISGRFTYVPPTEVGVSPYSLALSQDGSVGYLASETMPYQGAQVAMLKLPEGTVERVFPIADHTFASSFLSLSPNGSKLYSFFSTFCATDLHTYTTIGCSDLIFQTKVGTEFAEASTFALNADGTRAYIPALITNLGFGGGAEYLIEVDTSSMAVVSTLALTGIGSGFSSAAQAAAGIRYSSVTNSVYLQGPRIEGVFTGLLMRVDLGTFTIAARQQVDYVPNGMAITPDGTQLLVTGSTYGTQIFDGTTLAYTGYIPGGLGNGIVIPKQ